MIDIVQLFKEAEKASDLCQFDQARGIYKSILADQPDNAKAKAGLKNLSRLESRNKDVLKMIRRADNSFQFPTLSPTPGK